MALRQASAERDGSRGATAGTGRAGCGPTVEAPRSFGSARDAGGSPRGRAPATSSSFPHLSSSTGSLTSCRRRGSTGIARRFETSQGCSPRITSSGPPSPPSPSGGDWLVFRRNRCLSPAAGQEGQAPTAAQPEPVPPTTPHDAKGQTHGSGGRGVSAGVPGVWWRHPPHRVHYRSGADPEGPHASGRSARASASLSRPWPADRLGRARAGPLSTGQSFRDG